MSFITRKHDAQAEAIGTLLLWLPVVIPLIAGFIVFDYVEDQVWKYKTRKAEKTRVTP